MYARTLHRACQVLGGVDRLAAHLKVGEVELEHWIAGRTQPPHEVFLAAVEVILLHSERAGGRIS